jgi:hypothetical protein
MTRSTCKLRSPGPTAIATLLEFATESLVNNAQDAL